MADFNLGAEVSMDVDPIKASAKTLERELKGINQSLREQRKEFKQNEMSAEQLADMEKDLGRAIKAQEGLLTRRKKSLQDVKEEMAKSNEVTDEQRIKLQKADAAYRKAQNQLNGYTKELKDVQVASKTLGKSTDDIKGKLNSLRNEVKLSEAEFQKSSKATSDYEKHINNLSTSLNKSEANIKDLEDNLKIVSELKGENSREAKKLSSEIEKERLSYSQLEVSLSKVKNEFEDVKYENSELAQSINKTEKFIDNMKGNVNALSNELKRSSSSFKGSSQEADDYKNHLQQLTNIQTKQKTVIKELEDEYKTVTAIQGTSSQQAKQLKDEIDKQRTSFTSLDTQINQVTKQYDEYRLANSQTNITLGEAKRRLESYNNALEVNTVKFKNSNRSVESYQNQLNHTNATITQHKAVLESLKQRYEEVAHAQGKDSTEAEKLQREMYKEAVALEVVQSRADELSDELDEVARSQRKVALATTLMGAGFAGARNSADRIATTLRSLGEITQGVVGEIMATQFANLIPIMGSVVSAGAGIGGMLTSLAGGAIGLGGAFGIGMGAINAFAGQATYALKKLEDGELALTNETRRYQSVLSSLKNQWEGLIAQNQAKIFNTLSNGINIARTSLSNLNPFLTRTAGQIEGMSGKMLNWVKTSSNAKTAFNILNTQGTQAFGHLLQGAYHFVDGTVAVFNKLSPLFVWASKGFENMALSFRKWANSVEGSRAINNFIEYTKTNLPIVGRIFGNIFGGIFNLFSAFSGHSHNVLLGIESVTEGFKNWSAELKRSDGFQQFVQYLETNGPKVWTLIKNITGILWGLIKGMAPVGAVTLSVTNAITSWMSSMMNTHPMIGKILGSTVALTGAILLLLKPILLVKGALTGMRGALLAVTGAEKLLGAQGAFATLSMKKQATQSKLSAAATKVWSAVTTSAKSVANGFRYAIASLTTGHALNAVKTKISTVATKIWGAVTATAKGIADGFRYAVARLTTSQVLSTVKTKIATAATKAWTLVTKGAALATKGLGLAFRFMTGPIGIAITVIGALAAGIIYLWKNNETFRNFVIKAWTGIKNTAIAVFGFLKPYIIGIWTTIKSASIVIWNALKTAAVAAWNGIKFAVQHPIQALKNIVTAVWVGIKTASITIWNAIKNSVMAILRGWLTVVKIYFNTWKVIITAVWNAIKTVSIKVWNGIKNGVMAIIRGWITLMRASFTALKSFFSGIWNFIKNISVKTWNAIKNGVLSAVKALNTGVRKIISTLKSWMVNAWNFIKNKVVTLAKGLYTGVKNAFNSLWNATKKIFTTLKNWAVKIWTTLKNKVVALAKSLYTNVKKAFTNLWNSTKSIFNKLKNWVIKLWNSLKNKIISVAKSLYNSVKSRWNALWNTTKSIFSKLKNWAIKTWNTLKNKIISIVKSLWNGVKNRWNALWNGTRSIFNKVKNFMTSTWTKIKSSVVNTVKSLWSRVRSTFNNMSSGLKSIIGKIKGHITGMVNAVKKGLNKLIDGVNWVAGKIGMDKLPKMKLHTGTESTHTQNYVTNGKLNRDTLATVGDKGKGNGPGGFRHEMIRYPNGKTAITPNRDTTAFLPKGSTVYNGAQTHAMLSNNQLPQFSIGSMWKNAKKKGSQILNGVGDKANGVKHKAMAMGDKALDTAKGIAKGTFKAIGDVFDYVSNPGKLVDKVLSAAGVDFSFVKGDILGGLMKAMYKKLKNGIKNLFDGWLEEGGGADLSSFDKYPITTPYSPNARVPGYPFGNGRHYGIDYGTPSGTTIKAPTSGTVSRKHDYGGGLVARLVNGKFTQWFLHLSDILKTGKVKQGEPFAKTGNSGHWTTGAHLHYQVEKGINDYITNRNTIDPKKFASMGGGGGVNKSAAAWKPDIRRAAKAIGVRVSSADVNDVARLIQTESSGNAGVTQQIQDVNSGGNEAQGLLQYTPGSFNSYAIRGHKNIKNGYDQLLAFFNNTDWRANLSYWKRRMASGLTGWGPTGRRKKYAKGTNSAYRGLSTVFEEGGEIMNLRGGEQIIPNDVSIAAIESVINSDIFARTQSAVYEAISRFADGLREKKQQESMERQELRRLQMENTDIKEQNTLLKAILGKMDVLLNINNDINQSNQDIRDKNYFPSSKEMTRINNENNALNAKTRLMARRR
ncbi:peptidoglycan DD-metalloendopeptidase family protein [Staphylococcus haemolyticus]|uniref:peptidoglycan DD-metalloendopeptidase family protein n=1 Tax=Staphylococcus haemolyticus TaxID=1283 RepID=UPI001F172066|nr:peptidoglycan DD-metalloendopeptidase family protein [Staphylococcus haemolyticus]MCE4993184.1 peptidoglycan DD-metalloendopeptidase family protein [Staphylococcus haemolyticus]